MRVMHPVPENTPQMLRGHMAATLDCTGPCPPCPELPTCTGLRGSGEMLFLQVQGVMGSW